MVHLSPDRKIAGILAPVSALRGEGDLGMGDISALVELAQWASQVGFGFIQILPPNETGSDHSPYNIISSLAYEPLAIATTPEWLPDLSPDVFRKIVLRYDLQKLREGPILYSTVKALKNELLEAAFKNIQSKQGNRVRARAFIKFQAQENYWLEAYSFFRALIAWNSSYEVNSWPQEHRSLKSAQEWRRSLSAAQERRLRELIQFFQYIQWIAHIQWKAARAACDKLGIALMGDIPVGVSIDSADVWAHPELFDLTRSSGAPPEKLFKSDFFTEKWGQNWGFPLYNWHAMSRDNFAWWRNRLDKAREIFHFMRIDHALGFFRIYSFPWRPEDNERFTELTSQQASELTGGRLPGFVERDDSNEENKEFNRQHGEMLLHIFLEQTGRHRLIAEDLGEVPSYVRPMLAALEIPGFKIPQWERDENGHMIQGEDYERLSLATFATHDHPPLREFWEGLFAACNVSDSERRECALHSMRELLNFCGRSDIQLPQPFTKEIHHALICGLFRCNSWLVAHQITDVFGIAARFNVPGPRSTENWTTRVYSPIAQWKSIYGEISSAISIALRETDRTIIRD